MGVNHVKSCLYLLLVDVKRIVAGGLPLVAIMSMCVRIDFKDVMIHVFHRVLRHE